ncbi:MAG: DUF3089 domain-containing protein [Thermoleophilia bacterium]|nr:DUF3089 domain-containing protein [Thermoleophilia bacterium]
MKRLLVATLVLVAGGLTLAGSASAEPNFKWMCKPGLADNPCMVSLNMTSVTSTGEETVLKPKRAKKPPVDCFYVYPTVSDQEGPNADLTVDPGQIGAARQQAAIFSRNCRVFAPVYPQFTVPAIFSGQLNDEVIATAYAGVKAAWNEYLKKYNHGRGIVLIGHSQGTGHLGHLVEDTFDKKPKLRKRLVSAVLMGGNVYVPKGKRVGGQFKNIPACANARETGCIIASSGFLTDPAPSNSNFGRVSGALIEPGLDPDKYEVMCVNAAALDGSGGALKPIYDAQPITGSSFGAVLPHFPVTDTQYLSYPGLYNGQCVRKNGAHYLQVKDISTPEDERVRIGEPLGPTWGTHLTEVSDSGGNLIEVVRRQTAAYVKKVRLAKKKAQRKPK